MSGELSCNDLFMGKSPLTLDVEFALEYTRPSEICDRNNEEFARFCSLSSTDVGRFMKVQKVKEPQALNLKNVQEAILRKRNVEFYGNCFECQAVNEHNQTSDNDNNKKGTAGSSSDGGEQPSQNVFSKHRQKIWIKGGLSGAWQK